MCGISGIINVTKNQNAVGDLKAMTDLINHRGPDDVGYLAIDAQNKINLFGDTSTPEFVYSSDVPYKPTADVHSYQTNKFKIGLGHRRLSILDLSAFGHMPMSYHNGRYWITYNGEIYNFLELKVELMALGHHFISHTDTEVILAAYAEWKENCQDKMKGMWSFAIYDAKTEEIFLSRDRFGIKPLYYWLSPEGAFCFGSEIKQFTVIPGWKAILNPQRAYDFLMYSFTDHTHETMFAGVFHIPAGHYLKYKISEIRGARDGSISVTKWYKPQYLGFHQNFNSASEKFKNLFQFSVKQHLISDVPLGAALSGGLDSSAIVCEIDNLLKASGTSEILKTFSYCADDDRYNEKRWVEEVINKTNSTAHYIYLDGQEAFDKTDQLIWHTDEPYQSQSLLANYQVYKKVKETNIKVLLNGQGADEYLSGYGSFMLFRWVRMFKQLKFSLLKKEILTNKVSANDGLRGTYLKVLYTLAPGLVKRFLSRRTRSYKTLKSIISFSNLGAKEIHPYDSIPFNGDSIFSLAQKQLFHDPLQKYLRYEDRISMSHSIEARVPFLDHELVEFAMQLPADYLDGVNETKKIMTEGLKEILPAAIAGRKDKIGYITSEEKWVKETYTQEIREMLRQSIHHSKGILKPEALEYYDNVSKGAIPFDYTYWRMILFGIWMQKFNVQLN